MDKQADPIDQSTDLTLIFNAEAIEAVRRAARPEQVKVPVVQPDGSVVLDWAIKECECGEPLQPERLALGAVTCIDCKTEKERRDAFFCKR